MPVFEFVCDCGNRIEWFGSRERRPELITCEACRGSLLHRPSVSQHIGLMGTVASTTMRARGNAHKFTGISILEFKCVCGETFDEFVDYGEGESASDTKPCPKCGAGASWNPGSNIDRSSERFPYFDRGLGIEVQSKQHRRDICANPRKYGINSDGLIPVDGDWDADREMSKIDSENQKNLKGYDEYVEKLEHSPAFREYRRARDQGRL